MNLAFAANAGNAELVNQEAAKIQRVSLSDLGVSAKQILSPNNCSTLYYRAEN
jgi:hypothetical protein